MHLAHLAWDLRRVSQGRFALGLGTQVRRHIESRYSAEWTRPWPACAKWSQRSKPSSRAGRRRRAEVRRWVFHHTYMPPLFRPQPLGYDVPPIWVGAVGPRLTQTVAEVADGLLMPSVPYRGVPAGPHVARCREGTLGVQPRPQRVLVDRRRDPVCCGRDERELAKADAGTRTLLAFYGSTPAYAPVLELHGWSEPPAPTRANGP